MKKLLLLLAALFALTLSGLAAAATPDQFNAWKKEFPAAAPTDSPKLRGMISSYEMLVKQVTPAASKKLLSLLKDKLSRDQKEIAGILSPPKPNPKITAAMRTQAEEANKWLNGKFAPFFSSVQKAHADSGIPIPDQRFDLHEGVSRKRSTDSTCIGWRAGGARAFSRPAQGLLVSLRTTLCVGADRWHPSAVADFTVRLG